MNYLNNKFWIALSIAAIIFTATFTGCKDDDDNTDVSVPGSLSASDQTISQNTVVVKTITLLKDGWVVIHKDNGNDGPVVPDIISVPKFVDNGVSNNVEITIDTAASISDGEKLWIMLHTDDGTSGTYEFDGSSGLDAPVTDISGDIIMVSIHINSPSITVSDQAVTNNQITINKVEAAVDGWLVVHNDDGTGNITLPGIIGKTQVSAGTTSNVVIMLDTSLTYTPGQKLFPMLHIDNGTIGTYEFDGSANTNDEPEIFGNEPFPNNVIFTSFTVQ